MKKFVKSNFINEGFAVIDNVISPQLLREFNRDIKLFVKSKSLSKKINYKNDDDFSFCFKKFKNRKIAYKLLQDLRSIKKISNEIDNKLSEIGVYKKLGFKIPSIKNGLIVSLPDEEIYDNPLHQDIYNFYSNKFIKIWAPLTSVNNRNGSMKIYKGSHKLGFIKPEYRDLDHYPEIDKIHTKKFEQLIIKMKPGPIIIFNPMLIHSSIANKSNKSRFVFGSDIQDIANVPDNPNEKKFLEMQSVSNKRSDKRKRLNY